MDTKADDKELQVFRHGCTDARIIGDEAFVIEYLEAGEPVIKKKIPFDRVLVKVCEEFELTQQELTSRGRSETLLEARAIIGLIASESCDMLVSDVAHCLRRDASTLSRGITRIRKRIALERLLKASYGKICRELTVLADPD